MDILSQGPADLNPVSWIKKRWAMHQLNQLIIYRWVIRGYLGLLSSLPTGVWLGLKRNSLLRGCQGLMNPYLMYEN